MHFIPVFDFLLHSNIRTHILFCIGTARLPPYTCMARSLRYCSPRSPRTGTSYLDVDPPEKPTGWFLLTAHGWLRRPAMQHDDPERHYHSCFPLQGRRYSDGPLTCDDQLATTRSYTWAGWNANASDELNHDPYVFATSG